MGGSRFFFFWRKGPRRQSNWAKLLSSAKLSRKWLGMFSSIVVERWGGAVSGGCRFSVFPGPAGLPSRDGI